MRHRTITDVLQERITQFVSRTNASDAQEGMSFQ